MIPRLLRDWFPSGITGWTLPAEPPSLSVIVPETVAPPADPELVDRVATGQKPKVSLIKPPHLAYKTRCVGLCPGESCLKCQTLADRITEAKAMSNIVLARRRIRALEAQIAALIAQNTTMKEARG